MPHATVGRGGHPTRAASYGSATAARPRPRDDGLWSPQRRALTVGLVLTITLVAFEALAISTVMPIVADELGDMELYGWVFSAFFLGSLIGIVVVGGAIDRGGLGRAVRARARAVRHRPADRRPRAVDAGPRRRPVHPGPRRRDDPADRLRRDRPEPAGARSGRGCSPRSRPRGSCPASSARRIAGLVGEFIGWRFVFLGPAAAHRCSRALLTIRSLVAVPASDLSAEAEAAARRGRASTAAERPARRRRGRPDHGRPDERRARPDGRRSSRSAWSSLIPALRRLTPPGTLTRPARCCPAAVLLRGVLTFTFFGVDAYVSLTLEECRGLSAIAAGHRPDRGDRRLDGRLVDPGPRTPSAGRPTGSSGPASSSSIVGLAAFSLVLVPGGARRLVAVPTFAVAGLGMGLAYAPLALIVLREAAARGAGCRVERPDRCPTRSGRRSGRASTGAIVAAGAARRPASPATGLAVAFAVAIVVGLGGLALTGRLRPARRPAPRSPSATT